MKWVAWAMVSLPVTALIVVSWFSTAFHYWIPYWVLAYICVPMFVMSAISLNLMRKRTYVPSEWERNYH